MKLFRKIRAKHIKLGIKGEKLSCKLLKCKQYRILCKSYRPKNRSGEIDIVARDGRTLCFIEVKTRYNPKQHYYADKIWVSKDQIQRIKKAAKSYLNEISIEKVNGHCIYTYREGDTFIFNGFDTPNAFCGGAYTTLFPIIVALNSGARFTFENDPLCKTKMACPDNGNVIFSVRLLSE